MPITPAILSDFLTARGVNVERSGAVRLSLRDVRLPVPGVAPSEGYLYVVPADGPPALPAAASVAVCGRLPALPDDANRCRLCVSLEPEQLFTLIQDCFALYNEWIGSLYARIAAGGTLAELIELSRPILKNPVIIDDSSYQTLAKEECYVAEDFFDGEYAFVGKHGYHSPQYVSAMLAGPVAAKSASLAPRPVIHIFDFLTHRTVYSTVKVNDEVVGFLSVIELETPLTDGLTDLCEAFTVVLSVAMAKQRRTFLSKQKRLNNDLFLNVLNRSITDGDLTRTIFRQAGIAGDHRHFIALLKAEKDTADGAFWLSRMPEIFASNMPECYSILDESSIVLVVRDYPDGHTKQEILRLCSTFLQRSESVIGFSMRFDRPEQMPLYYEQAKAAIRFGPLGAPGARVFHYDEVIGYDLLDRLGDDEHRRAVCHPAVETLLAHDDEKGSNLLMTLRVLLECMGDTALAAERLFLHRNSLYYRMKQIGELTGVDTRDERTREHLLVSLRAHDINTANALAAFTASKNSE